MQLELVAQIRAATELARVNGHVETAQAFREVLVCLSNSVFCPDKMVTHSATSTLH